MAPSSVKRRLGAVVAKSMQQFSVPGVAVGVLLDGDEHHVSRGISSVERSFDVDHDTLFQIGSTTKTYTGTALMMLVEEGKIDLEAPVRTYLPTFKLKDEQAAKELKVRHLVTHTGGFLGDYFDDLGRGEDALRRIVGRLRTRTPQLTPVGKIWSYNNAGFYVLGRILEVVAGQPYETLINERIIAPLKMDNTFWFAEDVITRPTAIGHDTKPDGTCTISRPWGVPRTANPAGGIVSSVVDQLKYARLHLGDGRASDGTRLLKAATVRRMQKPLAPIGWGLADDVGVTWLLERIGGAAVVKHGGSINGHMSEFVLVPSKGFALVVLTNGSRGHELGGQVIQWCLDEVLGLRNRPLPIKSLTAKKAGEYTGRYPMGSGDFVVTVENGGLLMTIEPKKELLAAMPELADQLPPPLPLGFVGRDRAIVSGDYLAGTKVEFFRDDAAEVEWVRFGGRIYPRQAG
jgi:CubicO group peptidase (beta-lactamase class C family)